MEARKIENQDELTLLINELKSNMVNDISNLNETDFKKQVDAVYQVSIFLLSIVTTTSSVYFPPLSIVSGIALAVISGVHYLDEKNDYKLSHWMVDTVTSIWDELEKSLSANKPANMTAFNMYKKQKNSFSTNHNTLFKNISISTYQDLKFTQTKKIANS